MSGLTTDNTGTGSGVVSAPATSTESSSDPLKNTNPASGVGTEWHNTTSGQIFICTDATSNRNVWEGQLFKTAGIGDRGLWIGGGDSTYASASSIYSTIQYITISTTGNASNFGDLSGKRYQVAGVSNGANGRGVGCGGTLSWTGRPGGGTTYITMEYVTINTFGTATDLGDMTVASNGLGCSSNATNDRGIIWGGEG